jgi:CRP/FNR family transcriptional regulator, cyclic AMP receptor protein
VSSAEQIAATLAASLVLGRLDHEARLTLARGGRPLELDAGQMLFEAGAPGDAAFVVLEGELEVRRQTLDGRELRISALQAGAVVGEMAVLDGAPRSADVIAVRRSRLWRIPRAALLRLIERDSEAALGLLAELSRRLRAADAELEAARLLDLGGRLARLLLSERSPRQLVALTQTEMARRLGHSREKVNRKLASWAKSGWVEVTREGVRILDPDALSRH